MTTSVNSSTSDSRVRQFEKAGFISLRGFFRCFVCCALLFFLHFFEGSCSVLWNNELPHLRIGREYAMIAHKIMARSRYECGEFAQKVEPIPVLNDFYIKSYGMSPSEIRKSCYHYDRYQMALRTSLRSPT